jgi:capsular polysaccharide export protein
VRVDELPTRVHVHGLYARKRKILKRFLGDRRILSVSSCRTLDARSTLLLWGSAPVPEGCPEDVRIIRIEDGFLRSVGLGADLTRPVSWVFDGRGVYYDSTRPSDLEALLQTTAFTREMTARAAGLRDRLIAYGLTKYNVGGRGWKRPMGGRRVLLVPGQVESDASISFGAPGIRRNLDLLRAVREAHRDAWLIYKPHPDVLAGLRAEGKDEDRASAWCDERVTDVLMGELLPQVDEVHTATSLAGFEALLRGKKVTCYGQPFYSGWGLTRDLLPVERRTRRLSLDELVAGVLILYPAYVSRTTGDILTPEKTVEELLAWRDRSGTRPTPWTRLKRIVLRRVVGVR